MTSSMNVQSISRAFALLRAIAQSPQGITITDLARRTQLHKSTVSRLILTLEAERAVDRHNGVLHIGKGLTELVATEINPDLNPAILVSLAHPYLRTLVNRVNETAGLCIPDGDNAFYLDQVMTDHYIQIRDWTGERYPLHTVSSGKLFLAYAPAEKVDAYLAKPLIAATAHTLTEPTALRQHLAVLHKRGYDWSFAEFTEGLAVVSAPIFDGQGAVIASIYVCGPMLRFPPAGKQEEITALVVTTCQEITKTIAARQLHAKR